PAAEVASRGAAAPPPTVGFARSLGVVEALVVLVAVVAIVALFVGLQLAYLFGGLGTLSPARLNYSDHARRGGLQLASLSGAVRSLAAAAMTYSDSARRGYSELVAAVALAGGILVF